MSDEPAYVYQEDSDVYYVPAKDWFVQQDAAHCYDPFVQIAMRMLIAEFIANQHGETIYRYKATTFPDERLTDGDPTPTA